MIETIFDILAYILPLIIFFLMVYFLLRAFFKREERAKELEIQNKRQKETIPIQLQAYERLTLLLTRIAPENLIRRLQKPGMTAQQLKSALLNTIQSEFEHNLVQQIYVSNASWTAVVTYKDELIQKIHQQYNELPKEASSLQLAEAILQYYIEHVESTSVQRAIGVLKEEVKKIFLS